MIPWIKPKMWGTERAALLDAFDSNWFSSGQYVDKLEQQFGKIHGAKHAITTCNGTASIYLILEALGIGYGDKVVVPAFAFGAAANITSAIGAQPIFCDVLEDTFLLDPIHLEQILASEKDIKGCIPVHSYGNVCEMIGILELCHRYNVYVIEDVAESMFSKYENKFSGTFGIANSFSFQTTKTITTAEGGCVLTESDDLDRRMRLIRSHGMAGEKKYWHYERGNNFRLSNLLASLGYAQLQFWEDNVSQRKDLYSKFETLFKNVEGIKLQTINMNVNPVMWAFPVHVDDTYSKHTRDEMMARLRAAGIETRPGFYTFSQMNRYSAPTLKVSDKLASQIICLPFYLDLTDEEINTIHKEFLKLKR